MAELRFFKCGVCGNLVELLNVGGGTLVCCNQPMNELIPNTVDAAAEKHVPQITRANGKVKVAVGSVLHPMIPEHYIGYIYIVADNIVYRKKLSPGEEPIFEMDISDDVPIVAYEWCNLHGVWKSS